VAEWRLGTGSFLVLGDFPTASRDSRHWGPLAREALRHRLAP
jgi:type IV secretory pathway protease TraF